jgi:hypothetical protein
MLADEFELPACYVQTQAKDPPSGERQFSRFYVQTLGLADKEGTSGKTNPGTVAEVYDRQLKLCGRAIHETAIAVSKWIRAW